MNNKLFAAFCAALAFLMLNPVFAQSPTPIVVNAAVQSGAVPALAKANSDSMQATMKSLREMKSANEEILKKQQDTLTALDELQKTADQIKIFSKRG